ncbi:MAG TPA: hypothetical protein VFI47_28245 [Acidimicrobiales bacterium]|nr:hypothetical protein [Acidimicrobiales bacterium]
MAPTGPTSITLRTGDGVGLDGDLALPPGPARAAAVLCHPHPAYGGDRHNAVVDALFRALPPAGVAALRFDFRAAGTGAERLDVVAALDALAGAVPSGTPLWLAGYSFGADVSLSVDDPRAAGWVAVAPPLKFGDPPVPGTGDRRPVLLVVAEHDQYSGPRRAADATAGWPDVSITVVPTADHFLAGATATVATLVRDWIVGRGRQDVSG